MSVKSYHALITEHIIDLQILLDQSILVSSIWLKSYAFTYPQLDLGECDSKLRKNGYGHCQFQNGDLYHGLWRKDQVDEYGWYWWSKSGKLFLHI